MKQRYAFVFFLLLLLTFGFYIVQQKKQTTLFDKHIIDHIHAQKTNVFFEQADAYKYAQDYARARVAFEQLLPKARNADDSLYAYNQLIYCDLAMNEDSAAGKYIEELERHFPDVEKRGPSVSGDYFYSKGVFCYRILHITEAAFFLRQSMTETLKVYNDDHLHVARCQATLGIMFYEFQYGVDSAYFYLGKANDVFKSNKGVLKNWSAECLLGMAMAARSKRQFDIATGYCEEAIKIIHNQPFLDNIVLTRCLVNKARAVYMQMYNAPTYQDSQRIYKDVISFFEDALKVCPKNSFRFKECQHDLIRQFARTDPKIDPNQDKRFWYLIEQLISNTSTQANEIGGYPMYLKGYYYFTKQNLDSSRYYLSQFLAVHARDSTCFSPVITESNTFLSHIYETLSDKLKKPQLLDSALYYLKRNHLDYAGYKGLDLDWSDIIKPSFYKGTSLQFVTFSGDAKLFFKKYEKTKDLKSLNYAMTIANITDELLFSGLPSKDDDAFDFFQAEAAENTYGYAIKSACAMYDTTKNDTYLNDVFRFGERVRSFLLYRDMDKNDSLISLSQQRLLDNIRQIESDINALKLKTQQGNIVTIPLMEKQNQREMLYNQLKKEYPSYYQLKIAQPIPNVKDVQKSLALGKWLVQYTFSQDALHILYINRDEIFLYQTSWNEAWDKRLLYFCQLLNNKDLQTQVSAQAYALQGFELYQKLLPKLPPQYQTAFEASKELIISPDRLLNQLPFEALVESNYATNFKSLSYLLHCFPITYVPSWKIYTLNQTSQLPQSPSIHCYTYDTTSNELSSAKYEVNSLKKIFDKPSQLSLYMAKDCSSRQFIADTIMSYDILHLSLHAESDPLSKYDNKIYFAPKMQDALYGFDILKRRYTAKLVVLSACQTAYGKIKKGEGAYTLSRIFLRAGTPRVIASLWSINDKTTATITATMYERIIYNQKTPTQSLQIAKTHYLKNADDYKARPCFWAGLVCVD